MASARSKAYYKILEKADELVYVDNLPKYKATTFVEKLDKRNHWIVDNCDKMIAYYYNDFSGGTAKAISYAYQVNKMVVPLAIR